MFKDAATGGSIFEDTHKVLKFRRLLEPTNPDDPARGANPANRKQRLVQFVAVHGGMRTVAVDDIVEVR